MVIVNALKHLKIKSLSDSYVYTKMLNTLLQGFLENIKRAEPLVHYIKQPQMSLTTLQILCPYQNDNSFISKRQVNGLYASISL